MQSSLRSSIVRQLKAGATVLVLLPRQLKKSSRGVSRSDKVKQVAAQKSNGSRRKSR
jgi:hypothetical protein